MAKTYDPTFILSMFGPSNSRNELGPLVTDLAKLLSRMVSRAHTLRSTRLNFLSGVELETSLNNRNVDIWTLARVEKTRHTTTVQKGTQRFVSLHTN